jgi:Fic family protein
LTDGCTSFIGKYRIFGIKLTGKKIGKMSLNSTPLKVYSEPHQFEPLLPTVKLQELAQLARPVIEASFQFQGVTNPHTRDQLRNLVRSMNSYYSNRIEGQNTHPLNIDRALKADFSGSPDIAKRQRIALAHIQAERELENFGYSEAHILSSNFLIEAHKSLYGRLSIEDRTTDEGHVVDPGVLRIEDVSVFRHQPPTWSSVPLFLKRADQVYSRDWGLDQILVAAACAHHRLVWTHPFLDGNGRASRLQLHTVLNQLSGGLWSANRGLARNRDAYYTKLSEADMGRHGSLDGRGNLSEKMLVEWCRFFIEICHDQVKFMTKMLNLDGLKERIASLILIRSEQSGFDEYRTEAILPLHHVLAAGPVGRGDFVQMTGLGERTGRKILARLLKDGLLVSDTPKGVVSIAFPLYSLNILFPSLYPEASAPLLDD